MENPRKSDIVAFCSVQKNELYSQILRLESGNFLTMQEQKANIRTLYKSLEMLEYFANKNEQIIAQVNEAEKIIATVKSVESIIQSSIYKFSESWK